jgi:hypothetical protein
VREIVRVQFGALNLQDRFVFGENSMTFAFAAGSPPGFFFTADFELFRAPKTMGGSARHRR